MAIKRSSKKKAEFQPDAFRLGVSFAVKTLNNTPIPDSEETEEVISIEGYANFSGSCSDDASTVMDRVGDVVVPAGIEIANYKKSPVILFQHDRETVIGRAVTLDKKKDGLFVKAEIHAGACEEEVFYAIKNGLYTSFSIGFRTKKGEWKPVGDTEVFFITKSELLEISIVSIPCNTDSTFSLVKSFEGNFYAGELELENDPKPAPTVGANKSVDGDEHMKIRMRDVLPEDKVKELEALGLGESLDELKDVDTKSYIEALVVKHVTAAKAELEGFITDKTKAVEPTAQEETKPEQPTGEGTSEEEGTTNPEEKQAETPEVKEEEIEAIKSLSASIANLKTLAEEK